MGLVRVFRVKLFSLIKDPKLFWRLAQAWLLPYGSYSDASILVQSADGAESDTNGPVITIATEHTALVLSVGRDRRVYNPVSAPGE